MWKDLTLKDKAEIMKMSVANGVTDINDIKAIYDNETHNYQLGGYKQWKNAIAKYKHLDVDNDPTYDYEGFYNSDPVRAWNLLNEDPSAHFVDNFKTAQHPTFSKDSDYSGKFHPIYNPQGIEGGTWGDRSFTLPKDWQKGPSLQDRISYLEDAEDEGVTLYGPNGELPVIYNNDVWGGVLPNVDVYNKELGGHLFKEGGPAWSHNPASMIEHFEGFRESPYRDGTAWSVGYGQYKNGYGANLDWDALLSGKKKLTRSEAHQQVLRTVADLKKKLKNTLGEKLYNSLTPGQLMGYLDTGYQRPASMISAAKVHKNKGAAAAASVLGVSGFADRNAARRAAFTGNWDSYTERSNREYTPNKSTGDNYVRQMINNYEAPAFQPITLNSANVSSPWLDYISKIGQQRPVTFNTPIGPSSNLVSNNQINIGPVDFSNIGKADELMSFVDPYTSKQDLEYNLGLDNNALWNSPYLLFNEHSAANGGHLYDTAGQMLIRSNAVNPALQYVYGPEYEEIIRQRRNYRPSRTIQRNKPRYDIEARGDVTTNTARPTQIVIRRKQTSESPARRAKEQQRYDTMMTQYRNERQGTISQAPDRLRYPNYDPVKANQVQQRYEQNEIAEREAHNRRVLERNVLEGMEAIPWPSTVAGAWFNPNTHWYDPGSFFSNLYANDNRGFFNYNQATRNFYDANPEVGSVANLIGDFVVPGAAAKVLKGASRAGKAMATDFISDMRSLPSEWRNMRYALAHPETQTYGIIPDRLNPFTDGTTRKLKSFRDKIWTPNKILNNRIERLNELIENRVYRPVDDIVQTPYGDIPVTIRFDKLDPKETPLSEIEVKLGDSKNLKGLPLEEGMTISSGGEQPLLGNYFVPDKTLYFPGGESTQILKVKNVKGNVEIPFERGTFGGTRPYDSPKTFSPYSRSHAPTIVASRDNKMFSAYNEVPNFFVGVNQRVLAPQRPAILPEGHPIRRAAKGYIEDLEQRLVGRDGKPIASVEGSYRAVANGLPHSPNDVEFIVPEENLDAVRKVFNVRAEEPKSNGFGATISADEFDALPAGTADFEIIKNGPNGGAIGNTAWELYQYLHPEEASKLNMKYIREAGKDKKTIMAKSYRDAQELPISAKELFDEYMASGMYENKYMYDTLGAPRGKYASRRDDFGLAGDPDTYFKRLTEKIHSEFSGSKTLSEQGYNIDYTNVDANKAFLKYFELSEEYATNPKVMRNVVEEQMHAFQTVNRGTGISRPQSISEAKWMEKPVEERIQDIKNMNTQAKGGRGAGDGENATNQFNRGENSNTGVPNEVEVVRQIPLSIREETIKNIKTPEDLIKRIEEIEKLNVEHGQDLAKLNDLSTKQQTHNLAMEKDMPMVIGRDYGDAGQYIGNLLMGKDIGFDMRYVAGDKGFEITKPFQPQKVRRSSTWKMDETAARQLLQNTFDTVKKSNAYNSTVNRGIKLRNMRDKLWARQEIQQKTKVLGIAGLGTVTVGGLPYVLYENFVNTPTSIKEDVEYEKETLSKIESGDYRTLAYYLGKNPYDFKKLSNSEKEMLKRHALKELKQDIEGLEEQYNDKVK